MAKNLVIVESPAKCKTISRYLGKDFSVKATMGHIIDLPEKELGVDIEHDFKPKYTVSRGKSKVIKALQDDAKKAETIYLAPDPDREGEAIAWHVAQTLSESNTNVKRVQFNEITKKAVLDAINNPRQIDENKVNAQQARRILDRIVGYQVSPILWKTIFRGLSAGRVQSVALRIICEREDEIQAFKQEEYWSILAEFEHKSIRFTSKLMSIQTEKARITNGAQAQAIIDRIREKEFTITDVSTTEKTRKPYAPFITSTMQQEAARKLGFSAAKTMLVAQQLYEGLDCGQLGTVGLITYMRTDSVRIAQEALVAVRELIVDQYNGSYLPEAARVYGKSENAQDAHEAIRPSQISTEFDPKNLKDYLSKDQLRLYELVWKRFIASQMSNAVFDATKVDICVDDCLFRASGQVMKFDGFLTLYDETKEEAPKNTEADDKNEFLPALTQGTVLQALSVTGKQHFTQPPPRYSEASLVRELEDKGIGRPSTYAQIIDTLKRRKYVDVENRRFTPTEIGFLVKNILTREFTQIFDVGFTAAMESSLDKVEDGHSNWVDVLRSFYGPFNIRLKAVEKQVKDIKEQNQEVTDRMCPECKKNNLVIKWSRNGKFLACMGFPHCKYTEPLERSEARKTDQVCDKCGAPMLILNVKNNRFMGCSRYPECKNTKSMTTGVTCPVVGCGGELIERSTRSGKLFYGCNRYPQCTFATWDKPLSEPCPQCQYPVLVYKETKRKGNFKRCIQCKAEIRIRSEEDQDSSH
ncbi:MAG: type I DNA topoisomerase [Chitinivibrionales bacterium]|nr:type I DNA topoisomerase [Chitinivibrionales bacterium]